MAVSTKTLTPTGQVVSIPDMTEKPNASVLTDGIGKEADAINALNGKFAYVANYAAGIARVVEAISITSDVIFEAKIDCSNIVPNNKVLRILAAWIGVNPAGNQMMVAQNIGNDYVVIYMKSGNTQNISANADVTVALLYED